LLGYAWIVGIVGIVAIVLVLGLIGCYLVLLLSVLVFAKGFS